jgi:hypothetical protein
MKNLDVDELTFELGVSAGKSGAQPVDLPDRCINDKEFIRGYLSTYRSDLTPSDDWPDWNAIIRKKNH